MFSIPQLQAVKSALAIYSQLLQYAKHSVPVQIEVQDSTHGLTVGLFIPTSDSLQDSMITAVHHDLDLQTIQAMELDLSKGSLSTVHDLMKSIDEMLIQFSR